jgi:hypothetical protein
VQLPDVEQGNQCISLAPEEQSDAWWEHMAWAARIYGKGQIDRAGRSLASPQVLDSEGEFVDYVARIIQREEDIRIVDNWRACHAYPLQVVKMTLLNRAKKIDPEALIAQRLKRRPSIELKLRDKSKHEVVANARHWRMPRGSCSR